ncbi:hypothetical protein [Roseomonas indoligenes]|uniref:Uncharacterized protein n=1 Tax=Roseomonas indoligenes TaxID=2820811 RepID=A0A940MUE3_9PROT|nr:hypothetical protein [Pararoseomonas indoligenes]MBP0494313.1 hypothetical protein [Pararoseomonas indoligenes]
MAIDFDRKLRMAATALGCDSRKDLCARFRRVNPATACDVDRLNKWVQGRSVPRAASIYADFCAVIGSGKPGHWIAECSLEDFSAELAACTGIDATSLAAPDAMPSRGGAHGAGLLGGVGTLAGAFAAYSLAWSPHFRGRLIRGSLRLEARRNRALVATYAEALVGRTVRLSGEVQLDGRSMHVTVREPEGNMTLFFSLQVPGPPASVLSGIMSGVAFVAHESVPSACRIALVRVPETPRLDASNRYLEPLPGAIASDLSELGVSLTEADSFDAFSRTFLGESPLQVTTQQAAFASMLDRQYLDAAIPIRGQP